MIRFIALITASHDVPVGQHGGALAVDETPAQIDHVAARLRSSPLQDQGIGSRSRATRIVWELGIRRRSDRTGLRIEPSAKATGCWGLRTRQRRERGLCRRTAAFSFAACRQS